ncbi:MAG: aspartate dehydrogenase [Lachnospiraceae bacterium]|nr:aspartate dehydrogenase [Lachnospiraceae bacterium]
MGLFNKRKTEIKTYDREREYPVVRSSICTGEKVAGFKDSETGKFRDVMLIRNDKELETFKKLYDIEEIKTEY